ncbi:arfaptin-1-like isoform X4 [Cyprinodon tularosa]|uniref:arfaptin-1-like isoform X4 n=1 Tax=Cyprinodon tularosa TaxID=77115 RepID=UPI0018E24BB4|nr:arfaptin-1-like isoform X4 [Cyprinodon tularosa]
MMEAMDEKEDATAASNASATSNVTAASNVSAASNTTEEGEELPPKLPLQEANSNCNHTEESKTEGSAKAAEVPAEPQQSEEPQSPEVAVTPQKPNGGPVVIEAGNRNLASEKLERVRKWSISKYKFTRQALAEKLGRGSRTVDLDLEPRLELLKDDRQRYDNMTKLAQTLASQFAYFSLIEKALGETFNELSFKSKNLHVEFGMNAEAQKFLSKSTDTLTSAINSFTSDMDTLVNKTIEDTMISAKQYEVARIEYDAYRVDLEELNMGPRDANTLPKLEQAQKTFQGQRERYQKVRDDLSVKVKLLEENRVKVLHNQLWLLHSAVAAHCMSCHSFLEKNMEQAVEHLNNSTEEAPSWLEES